VCFDCVPELFEPSLELLDILPGRNLLVAVPLHPVPIVEAVAAKMDAMNQWAARLKS
jgi:hypothetical protein